MLKAIQKISVMNQVLNFFWTSLAFIPVMIFWWNTGINIFFFTFVLISVFFIFIPEKFLSKFQLSNKRNLYEKFGVKIVRKFVQNGEWIRSTFNESYKPTIKNISKANAYVKTIYIYERFHWLCFIFFLFSSIYAICMGKILLGFLIFLCNLIYNVAAICLQQYNKLRILSLHKYK